MDNSEYKLIPFTKLNAPGHYIKNKVVPWCVIISTEKHDKPAAVNMGARGWLEREETLAYILWNKKRFYKGNGQYYFLEQNDEIIAGSGIYKSEFCSDIAIGSVRTFVNKDHRGNFLLGNLLWPAQLAWATRNNYKMILLTFNDYNKPLMNVIKRNGLGVKKNRTDKMFFHNGVYEVPFMIDIKGVPQWAIYHKIDETFDYDWESLRWKEPAIATI